VIENKENKSLKNSKINLKTNPYLKMLNIQMVHLDELKLISKNSEKEYQRIKTIINKLVIQEAQVSALEIDEHFPV